MRYRLLLVLLLWPALCFAVTNETQYITTSCGNNGDGTSPSCSGSPGGAGAYNTFANWEGQNRNLVSQDKSLTVQFSGSDTASNTIAGWTTDSTRSITINGLVIASTGYYAGLQVDQNFVTLNDCNLSKNAATTSIRVLEVTTSAVTFTVNRCKIWHGASQSKDAGHAMVEVNAVSSGNRAFRNLLLYDSVDYSFSYATGSGETATLYNITIINNTATMIGLELAEDSPSALTTMNVKNVLVTGANGTGALDYSITASLATFNHSNNISSDTSSPDVSFRSKTISYVNAGSDDYHLQSGETDAIDQGADLSSAGVTDDLDKVSRAVPYDIGAYEFVAAGTGAVPSVRQADM